MLGGEPGLCSAESSWFFRRYSNTSHRRRVQNKERSSPLAFGPSHLLLLFAVRYSLSELARIPRVDYKRKPT